MGCPSGLYQVRLGSLQRSLLPFTDVDRSITPFKANYMHAADVPLGELKL